MLKKTDAHRSKLYVGFAGVAALALFTACGADEPTQEEEPADPEVEQEDPMQEDPADDPMQDDPADDPMEDDAEIEGAGVHDATSTVGLVGNTVSWGL